MSHGGNPHSSKASRAESGYQVTPPPSLPETSQSGDIGYDEDLANMAEIEREMTGQQAYNAAAGAYNEEDLRNLEALDRAEQRAGGDLERLGEWVAGKPLCTLASKELGEEGGYGDYQQPSPNERSGQHGFAPRTRGRDDYQPVSHSGALSAHAAEFWFPESRNCDCCKGFKHGCSCIANGVTICQNASCTASK